MYKCEHFGIEELVGPSTHEILGEKAWRYFNPLFLQDLDTIREHVHKITGEGLTVNDWSWGGGYTESGLRVVGDHHYKHWSGHSWGMSFDIKLNSWLKGALRDSQYEWDADWLRGEIIQLKKGGKLKAVTDLEVGTKNWIHIGSRNIEPNFQDILFVFEP